MISCKSLFCCALVEMFCGRFLHLFLCFVSSNLYSKKGVFSSNFAVILLSSHRTHIRKTNYGMHIYIYIHYVNVCVHYVYMLYIYINVNYIYIYWVLIYRYISTCSQCAWLWIFNSFHWLPRWPWNTVSRLGATKRSKNNGVFMNDLFTRKKYWKTIGSLVSGLNLI